MGQELSNDDRNLLSVAYKNWIGSRRTAWRAISAVEQKEEAKGSKFLELLRAYKRKIEDEVEKITKDVADLLDKSLISKAKDNEAEVFYLKMKADYYRYFAECVTGEKNKKAGELAHEAYKKATEKAASLPTTHAVRLGLALNYSVFLYEIINSPEQACKLAKTTFDAAIGDLEHLEDEQYKESASIMQLLRDNLTLWTADAQEEEAPAGKEKADVEDL
jgi:14-3-3 protein epsilon